MTPARTAGGDDSLMPALIASPFPGRLRASAGLSAAEPPPHAAPVSADREERGQHERRGERQGRDRGVPEVEAHGEVGHLHVGPAIVDESQPTHPNF